MEALKEWQEFGSEKIKDTIQQNYNRYKQHENNHLFIFDDIPSPGLFLICTVNL